MSEEDASLLSWWSFLELVGFWMVLGGVVLEGAELAAWIRWKWKSRNERKRGEPISHAEPEWAKWVGAVGYFVLVVGLALELRGHIVVTEITDREERRLVAQLNDTTQEAGDAKREATLANQRAAILHLRASSNELAVASANERAAKSELELAQIKNNDAVNLRIETVSLNVDLRLPATGDTIPDQIEFLGLMFVGNHSLASTSARASIGPGGRNQYSAVFTPRRAEVLDGLRETFPTALEMGKAWDMLDISFGDCSATNAVVESARAVLIINGRPFKRFDLVPIASAKGSWRLKSSNSVPLIPALTNAPAVRK